MANTGTEHRKLAAIMFTDMVGYSTLAQRNEALALGLLDEHRRLLRSLFPRFNGVEVKTIGDAFLVEFGSALEAAQCAIEIQRTLAKRNADAPAERQIQVRIGIHIGDVIHREGDVYGDGVNIASRIEQVAGPNGICISMDVERQIRHALEASLVKLPAAELKNIQVPMDLFRIVLPWESAVSLSAAASAEAEGQKSEVRVRTPTRSRWIAAIGVLAVVLALGAGWWLVQHRPAGRIRSLAVRPVDEFSGDTNQAYLSDNMTVALRAALGNISVLRVPGLSTILRYKHSTKAIPEMARELNVDAIVEGSIRREGSGLRINVQLIEAAADRQLWSTNFQCDLSEFFVVQDEVARAIAEQIQVRLTPEDQARLARARTARPDTIEAYLRGMHHWWEWSEEGATNALRYFQRAVKNEPDYAPAYAGMALVYITGSGFLQLWSPSNGVARGKEIAQKAIQLDPMLADGYVALGLARANFDWDWSGAEMDLKKALELNPNSSLALDSHGFILYCQGRFDEATKLLTKALELDPMQPGLHNDLGVVYWGTGQLDRAITHFRRALELNPNFYVVRSSLAFAYQASGKPAEAAAEFQSLAQSAPDVPFALGCLGYFYGVTSREPEARKVLAKLDDLEQKRYVTKWARAMVHLGLGQTNDALDSLDKACAEHDGWMWSLKVDPWYDPLRNQPRFQNLLKMVGFDP